MEMVVADLEKHFNSLKRGERLEASPNTTFGQAPQATQTPRDYSAATVSHSNFGSYNRKTKQTTAGISYGQPQFFSPVYTPINWQIPSRRREIYMWCRYWYENEPRVATAIDFYSKFPITTFETECSDRYIKHFFDEEVNKKLNIDKWARLISHEVHLMGDCFPFKEIECDHCGGSGRIGDEICEHEGGTFKRLLILNPDFVEVFSNSISPEDVITYVPDDELRDLVIKSGPGTDKLSKEVKDFIAQGRPIPLDSRNVSHLKFGESGYRRYGISMTRRLFPILSYKTKIMTAQWIVAERLILPIKVVKVGTEERPASEADITAVQGQLQAASNDPNMVIVTHHAFELDWVGANGQVLPIQGEYEFINQEIMDGFGLNKQLITGEGPTYSSAAMGAEIMIKRLESWRLELKRWIEEEIYLPISKMKGFRKTNEWGEDEWIYPKIKWGSLNLRDRQQERQMILQLFDKGLISATRVLTEFDIDPDTEFEQMRWERIEAMAEQPPGQAAGEEGGMGGMDMGGGLGGGGGGLDLGGGMGEPGGGDLMGGEMGGGMGDPGDAAPMGLASSKSIKVTSQADPGQYGGKILTDKTREKLDRDREKVDKEQSKREHNVQSPSGVGGDGFMRDRMGRIMLTSIERAVIKAIENHQRSGKITYNVSPSYEVHTGGRPVMIDVAFPDIKLGVECDGTTFHGSPENIERDKKRDQKLNNKGRVIIRFGEEEIESNIGGVMTRIMNEIGKRERWITEQRKKLEEKRKNSIPDKK